MIDQITDIPDKLFFRIGEVSELIGVEPYVLRYWESEFSVLSPKKSSSGQRMFRRRDVEILLSIKHLLYDKKFTIDGARKVLQDKTTPQEELFAPVNPISTIRREVAEILGMLT